MNYIVHLRKSLMSPALDFSLWVGVLRRATDSRMLRSQTQFLCYVYILIS